MIITLSFIRLLLVFTHLGSTGFTVMGVLHMLFHLITKMVMKKPVSRDRLFNAYVRAALARGASYRPSHVDKMNTAAFDDQPVNDLF